MIVLPEYPLEERCLDVLRQVRRFLESCDQFSSKAFSSTCFSAFIPPTRRPLDFYSDHTSRTSFHSQFAYLLHPLATAAS